MYTQEQLLQEKDRLLWKYNCKTIDELIEKLKQLIKEANDHRMSQTE